MRLLVTGATGFIGRRVVRRFARKGHQVAALSRRPERARAVLPELDAVFAWGPPAGGGPESPPAEAFGGMHAVIHLAGESVAGRWTRAKRAEIHRSRAEGTRRLVQAIASSRERPAVLISMSAIGYYGSRGEETLTESSGPGDDFLASVCRAWEEEAMHAAELGVRVVRLRCGIALGEDGGALRSLLLPARLGLAGPLGSGRQWWSWIHVDDVVRLMEHVLEHDLSGPVNATAPQPVRQREFARALGRVLRRPAVLPVPAPVLKLVLGGFACEVLDSKRVLPQRALASGFRFQFETLDAALDAIVGDGAQPGRGRRWLESNHREHG